MTKSELFLGWIGGWSGLGRVAVMIGALGVGYAVLQPADPTKQAIAKRSVEEPHLTGTLK